MAGPRTNSSPWLVLTKLVGTLVVTGVLAAGVLLPFVGGVGLAAKHEADQFLNTACNLRETPPPQKTQIVSKDGTLIATIFKQDRQPVALSAIPVSLRQALVATEDRRFYQHHGVDMRGLLRSAVSTSGGDTQGGSTLTMQYVKQMRLYQAGDNVAKQQEAIAQTLDRKIEDAKCALYIEGTEHESKDEILQNYLNIAFFGENSFGIQTAAQTYFGKNTSQLTLPESAMLVGLLRAPTQYDPFQYPEAARERRDQVLQNLVTVKDLTQAQADKYKATPVSLATTSPPPVQEGCDNASAAVTNVGFFCKYAVNWLLSNNVVTETQLETGGLKIVTSLDAKMQNSMQANISKALSSTAPMTAIMPVVDPHTGNVLAMASSKKFGSGAGATTLPIFTSYTAQGASTYKLFPLLTALSTGVPSDWELQTPTASTYQWTSCPSSNGNVGNGDANETFYANETLASATQKSSNTFFTGIADQLFGCNLQPIIDMASKLGMKSLSQPSDERGLTVAQQILKYSSAKQLVLGDIATSPLELTSAYATIANDGKYNAPSPILSITDSKGQAISVPHTAGKQVVSPWVAKQAVSILTGDTQGVGTSAASFQSWYSGHSSVIAGKTGTATGIDLKTGKDDRNGALWFVGMTPDLTATTALIDLDHPSYPASGLPGISNEKVNAYGAYAAGVWLKALKPSITSSSWSWQTALDVPGTDVPDVTGYTLDNAKQTLTDAGYKVSVLGQSDGLQCASSEAAYNIAFYGPKVAAKGSTITVCQSSGIQQDIYVKPKPTPTRTKTKTNTGSAGASSGTTRTGGTGGTGRSGAPGQPTR